MPMARISLLKGQSPDFLHALADNVYRAMVDALKTPPDDRFQIIHQHEPHELIFDRHYRGGPRSDGYVLICITTGWTRDTATKQAFYQRLVELLAEAPGIAPEDVMVVINTSDSDGWSFGGGRGTTFDGKPAEPAR